MEKNHAPETTALLDVFSAPESVDDPFRLKNLYGCSESEGFGVTHPTFRNPKVQSSLQNKIRNSSTLIHNFTKLTRMRCLRYSLVPLNCSGLKSGPKKVPPTNFPEVGAALAEESPLVSSSAKKKKMK